MYRLSKDKGLLVADLMALSPYDLTLEWLAREAWLSECTRNFRDLQGSEPSHGQHRFTWTVNQ